METQQPVKSMFERLFRSNKVVPSPPSSSGGKTHRFRCSHLQINRRQGASFHRQQETP